MRVYLNRNCSQKIALYYPDVYSDNIISSRYLALDGQEVEYRSFNGTMRNRIPKLFEIHVGGWRFDENRAPPEWKCARVIRVPRLPGFCTRIDTINGKPSDKTGRAASTSIIHHCLDRSHRSANLKRTIIGYTFSTVYSIKVESL